ncbi:HAD family hydrolase [Longispora sp. K20-0274]|uniref:HAD family hydrolase n=1 Tax=Longispora sp. K20-0274 TaxID=3088255 RepID=UPI003999917A
MSRPRAILIDLDDTLIDDQPAVSAAFAACGRHAAAQLDVDAARFVERARQLGWEAWDTVWLPPVRDWLGIAFWDGLSEGFTGAHPHLNRFRDWLPDYRRKTWGVVLEEFGCSDPRLADDLGELFTTERHAAPVGALPGAARLLKEAGEREEPVVVITNGAADGQRRKLRAAGLDGLVSDIVISTEIGVGKPSPAAFLTALSRVGSRPQDAVMVGDSFDRDVLGSTALGMRTLWITGEAAPPELDASVTLVESVDRAGYLLHR